MAWANRGATDRVDSSGQWAGAGTVSVVTTSVIPGWDRRRCTAVPVNSPWVHATDASAQPSISRRSISSTIDPPVAISSSRTIARRPATSPTMASTTTRSSAIRRLLPAATGTPSSRANWVAVFALPRSGDTTTVSDRSRPL